VWDGVGDVSLKVERVGEIAQEWDSVGGLVARICGGMGVVDVLRKS